MAAKTSNKTVSTLYPTQKASKIVKKQATKKGKKPVNDILPRRIRLVFKQDIKPKKIRLLVQESARPQEERIIIRIPAKYLIKMEDEQL